MLLPLLLYKPFATHALQQCGRQLCTLSVSGLTHLPSTPLDTLHSSRDAVGGSSRLSTSAQPEQPSVHHRQCSMTTSPPGAVKPAAMEHTHNSARQRLVRHFTKATGSRFGSGSTTASCEAAVCSNDPCSSSHGSDTTMVPDRHPSRASSPGPAPFKSAKRKAAEALLAARYSSPCSDSGPTAQHSMYQPCRHFASAPEAAAVAPAAAAAAAAAHVPLQQHKRPRSTLAGALTRLAGGTASVDTDTAAAAAAAAAATGAVAQSAAGRTVVRSSQAGGLLQINSFQGLLQHTQHLQQQEEDCGGGGAAAAAPCAERQDADAAQPSEAAKEALEMAVAAVGGRARGAVRVQAVGAAAAAQQQKVQQQQQLVQQQQQQGQQQQQLQQQSVVVPACGPGCSHVLSQGWCHSQVQLPLVDWGRVLEADVHAFPSFKLASGYERLHLPAGIQVLVVEKANHLPAALAQLRCSMQDEVVAIDLEWRPENGRGFTPVAMMQLASSKLAVLVRTCRMGYKLPEPLRQFLLDSQVHLLGFSWAGSDEAKMKSTFGLGAQDFGRFLDLQEVAQGLGYHGFGLARLARQVLGLSMPKSKRVTMSNWEAPVLSRSQVTYAALDVLMAGQVFRALRLWHSSPALCEVCHYDLGATSSQGTFGCRECDKAFWSIREYVQHCQRSGHEQHWAECECCGCVRELPWPSGKGSAAASAAGAGGAGEVPQQG